MSENSKIEWTDHTFNPWWGCTKVSPACDHCYAETFSRRVGFSETGSQFPIWGKDARRRFFGGKHWAEPLKWDRDAEKSGVRKRVFCGSMCDVMEEHQFTHGVDVDLRHFRARLYWLIEKTPWLDWLLLTKRPQNFRRFLPKAWLDSPRPNVWLLTSVESSDYYWRIAELLSVPAIVHGLSCEPLLSPLDLRPYLRGHNGDTIQRGISDSQPQKTLSWVICGGESGPGARPMHPAWARSLRDQCVAAGVAFHFKQWGEWGPSEGKCFYSGPIPEFRAANEMGLVRVGKKADGRLLDGRTWDEVPCLLT